ncbi:lysophospholipid acyltransferase family protein [Segetibacter aerophilus]|uniref:1-acyl-sn-glycerol-3-phosphate acyltransferase n=1 Tax=Segetibacter aerophilus TaxID=670293 RepID=A0A512BAZ0_9BACT|nr:lysophospholipid acyltransferase family protein [Segetibacter aerophilus]GEO08997.1 1-acyl-sn-glycerol-3-phosphate acyltransferase [Segetibacter aerophilus]
MKILLKPLQWIYCVYALLMFIAIMFVAVPFVIVASFFGRVKGGNFIYKVVKAWGYTWYFIVGIRHKNIFEVPHDSSRQYIFIANHISYMDIPPVVMALSQPVRILAKYEMSKVPIFGYIYKSAAVMVKRSDADNRAQSVLEMKEFISRRISIFIFPEGTLNETGKPLKEFFDGAFRIAIETETPLKIVLFVDTVDRLHFSSIFTLTPGQCRVVFLDEVPVKGLTLNDLPALKEKAHKLMEAGLRRYRKYPEEV